MKSRDILMGLAFVSLLIIGAAFIASVLYLSSGVSVEVRNVGNSPIGGVTLMYAEGAIELTGVIKPGESVPFTVKPTSESHFENEFRDSRGMLHEGFSWGYFEPGYTGKYIVEIDDTNQVTVVKDTVGP